MYTFHHFPFLGGLKKTSTMFVSKNNLVVVVSTQLNIWVKSELLAQVEVKNKNDLKATKQTIMSIESCGSPILHGSSLGESMINVYPPTGSMGLVYSLDLVDFLYGFHAGKYTCPMDHLGHGTPPPLHWSFFVFCFTATASSENPKSSPQPGGTQIGVFMEKSRLQHS